MVSEEYSSQFEQHLPVAIRRGDQDGLQIIVLVLSLQNHRKARRAQRQKGHILSILEMFHQIDLL